MKSVLLSQVPWYLHGCYRDREVQKPHFYCHQKKKHLAKFFLTPSYAFPKQRRNKYLFEIFFVVHKNIWMCI